MLKSSAEADKAKALLSLDLLGNKSVGIGDHSTEDFYKNAEEALIKLVDADDRLNALEDYFEEVIISEQTPWKKPRPEIFKYSLNQADAKAEESIMIGDDIRADIHGAASVGMDQIWVNFNNADTVSKPTYVVYNLLEILNIL